VATIRIILSLSQEEEKSENPVHMKTKNLSLVLIPLLTYFSASHSSQAVNPPPDGDYPGGNTAEGQNDLLSLTAGTYNTAVGWFSLQSNLTGGFNTANGTTALISNTTCFGNVATRFQANLRRKRSLTSSRFSRAANDLGYSKEAAMFSPGGFPFR